MNCRNSEGYKYAENSSDNGGSGGEGRGHRTSSSWYTKRAGGGAGNPGGKGGENSVGNTENGIGENGTGGLLVIYANSIGNTGKIEANGSKGGLYGEGAGGSLGGGSINIFYNKSIEQNGIIVATGGEAFGATEGYFGGKGGDGAVSIGEVPAGSYNPYQSN